MHTFDDSLFQVFNIRVRPGFDCNEVGTKDKHHVTLSLSKSVRRLLLGLLGYPVWRNENPKADLSHEFGIAPSYAILK